MTRKLFNRNFITGEPGTGKSTVLQVILDIYQRVKPDGEILLAAPTGRASKRMMEATGYPSARLEEAVLAEYKVLLESREDVLDPYVNDPVGAEPEDPDPHEA